jgi:hypothetical protein
MQKSARLHVLKEELPDTNTPGFTTAVACLMTVDQTSWQTVILTVGIQQEPTSTSGGRNFHHHSEFTV